MADKTNLNLSLYYAAHSDPDAIVILNRGEADNEIDLTPWVVSFNTSNSIDSVSGSFTVSIDNTDDYWIDRFNFCKIKKMSSIEIFVKAPQNFFSNSPSAKSKSPSANSNKSNATAVRVPNGVKTIDKLIDQLYGADYSQRENARQAIVDMNKDRYTTVPAYEMLIQGLFTRGITYNITTNTSSSARIKFIFTPRNDGELSELTLEIGAPSGWDKNKKLVEEKDGFIRFPSVYVKALDRSGTSLQSGASAQMPQQLSDFARPIFIRVNIELLQVNGDFNEDAIEEAIFVPLPTGENLYQRIFFGVVTTIAHNTSPATNMTVTLSGKGIGYWLEATVINQNPGGFEVSLTGQDLTAFQTRLAEKKALDIFKEIVSLGTGNLPVTTNLSVGTLSTSYEILKVIGDSPLTGDNSSAPAEKTIQKLYGGSMKVVDPSTGKEATPASFKTINGNSISEKLKDVENKIRAIYFGRSPTMKDNINVANPENLRVGDITKATCEGDQKWVDNSKNYLRAEKEIIANKTKIAEISIDLNSAPTEDAKLPFKKRIESLSNKNSQLEKDKDKAKSALESDDCAAYRHLKELDIAKKNLSIQMAARASTAGRDAFLNSFGIIDHWKKIFGSIILEVMDEDSFLNNVYPFSYAQKAPDASIDGDYITKATLAKNIANQMQYEFYFDANGHFILKPPLYNIDHTLMGDLYEIEDVDVISFSCNDTAEGILTRVATQGDFRESPGAAPLITRSIFQDMHLIRDYGWFQSDIANLYFVKNPVDARQFGEAYMSRMNANLFNATITIHGRPQLRIGTSVYFKPRDTVFYIKDISHELTAGGSFQTTLSVVAGRRIVVGFKSTIKARTINVTVDNGKTVVIGSKDENSIQHYIQAKGLNTDSLIVNNFQQGVADRDIPVDSQAAQTAGVTPQSSNTLYILKNKYIITNHPTPAFIGLIVDEQNSNGVLAQINKANFDYFFGLSSGNIPSEFLNNLVPLPSERELIANKIREYFRAYVSYFDISASTFDMSRRNQFIDDFLTSVQDAASGNDTSLDGRPDFEAMEKNARNSYEGEELKNRLDQIAAQKSYYLGKDELRSILEDGLSSSRTNVDRKKKLYTLAQVFNNLVNFIDINGSYRQFTDSEGREIPSYQNYGLGYGISDKISKLANDMTTQQTLNRVQDERKKQEQIVKSRSRSLSGVYDPNSNDYKKILTQAFTEYRNTINVPTRSTDKQYEPNVPNSTSQNNPPSDIGK